MSRYGKNSLFTPDHTSAGKGDRLRPVSDAYRNAPFWENTTAHKRQLERESRKQNKTEDDKKD